MKLSVNVNQTIKNFGCVFSDSFKVIQELIQNARRAGATQVDITMEGVYNDATITVADNGAGIGDFGALFMLSESGWVEDVKANEQPFGMGFYSTLYCSKKVIVQSKGQRIEIDTASAIAMEDFGDVQEDVTVNTGTVVTLFGVDIPSIYNKLCKLAETSSIAITFNGELLARPYAFSTLQDEYPVVETPYGKLVLRLPFYEKFSVVVQDIVVAKNFHHYDAQHNILFADSNQVRVRMPDRDAIINASDFIDEFQTWQIAYFKAEILLLRGGMANDIAFLDKYYFQVLRYVPSLLNDIPYLPGKAFVRVPFPAMCFDEYMSDEDQITHGVHRGDSVIVTDCDYDINVWRNALIATYLHEKKAQVVMTGVPKDHWIFSQIARFNVTDFKVEVVNPVFFSYGRGKILCAGEGLVCDDLRIIHIPTGDTLSAVSHSESGGRQINFAGMCQHVFSRDKSFLTQTVYTQEGDALDVSGKSIIAVNGVGSYESLLCQLEYYYDDDIPLEDELSDDDAYLVDQIKVSIGCDIGAMLTSLVGPLSPELAARLNGKTAAVRFVNGEAIFEIAS